MRNANKSPKILYSAMVRKVEKSSAICFRDWIINFSNRQAQSLHKVSITSADYFCINAANKRNE